MNDDITDEIEALNAIYGPSTISPSDSDPSIYTLTPPLSVVSPQLELHIRFPRDYPTSEPEILAGHGGTGIDLARETLARVRVPGEVCLYDLVEGLREVMPGVEEEDEPEPEPDSDHPPSPPRDPTPPPREATPPPAAQQRALTPEPAAPKHPWTVSESLVDRKSVFVGRAIAVNTPEQAQEYIAALIAGDKKIAKATHNMTAYRIQKENGVVVQDNDDDGETAAGGRLGHLLQVMDVWNVVVVVSRWYGGIQLGPDRFRLINQAARDALVSGGFVKEEKQAKKGKKKK